MIEMESGARPEQYVYTTFQRRLGLREAANNIAPADQLTTPEERQAQYDRLEGMIGNTPLLGLRAPNGSWVLVKAEFQNPTESHYDRVYVKTLRELEARGMIKPGDDLFEVTSGSAGISFAWACSRLGYNAHILVPKGTPVGRNQEILNFGAELIEEGENIPGAGDAEKRAFVDFVRKKGLKAKRVPTEDDMFILWSAKGEDDKPGVHMINHSANHFTHHAMEVVGDEIAAELPEGTAIDYFVSILGNGTNTRGISDGLARHLQGVKTIGVENKSNPVQFETKDPGKYKEMFGEDPTYEKQEMVGSSQQGTKLSFLDVNTLDNIELVTNEEMREQMSQYNRNRPPIETIGRTSAAGLVVAKRIDATQPGSIILTVFYDKGDRYDDVVTGPTASPMPHPIHGKLFATAAGYLKPMGKVVELTEEEKTELHRKSLAAEIGSFHFPEKRRAKARSLYDLPQTLDAAANDAWRTIYDQVHPEYRDI